MGFVLSFFNFCIINIIFIKQNIFDGGDVLLKTDNQYSRLFFMILSITLIMILTSCGGSKKNQSEESSQNETIETTIETKSNEATIIVEDSSNQ